MQLSDGERLITIMLAEVMQSLKLSNSVDPKLISTLASNGDDWAIERHYQGIFGCIGPSPSEVKETTDILWMWGIIEHSLTLLTGAQATTAQSWHWTSFSGFDGNHDRHYGIAHTMINELGEFSNFKTRALNSHSQTNLPRYLSMYQTFDGYIQSSNASPLPFAALQSLCS
jgi:uncharacterized protein YfbU (UPF0304 family)